MFVLPETRREGFSSIVCREKKRCSSGRTNSTVFLFIRLRPALQSRCAPPRPDPSVEFSAFWIQQVETNCISNMCFGTRNTQYNLKLEKFEPIPAQVGTESLPLDGISPKRLESAHALRESASELTKSIPALTE